MKILASDYDGTLRTEELVDINDVHAIHEFRAAGNMFGLVTGRSMESIQTEIQKNKIEFDFIVANNGGVIYDRDFQRLQVLYMDFNKALDIIAYIKPWIVYRMLSMTASTGLNFPWMRIRLIINTAICRIQTSMRRRYWTAGRYPSWLFP